MTKQRICSFCGRSFEGQKSYCPFCKQLAVKKGLVSNSEKYGESICLSEIKSITDKRLSSGPWDQVFGFNYDENGEPTDSGLVLGSTILIGGQPGSGKSTLVLHIADAIAAKLKDDEYILMLASEEKPERIKTRCQRLGLSENLNKIRIISGFGSTSSPSQILEDIPLKPTICIIDSTDGWPCDWVNESKNIQAYCANSSSTVILIHHVNKDIEFTGRMDIQHNVDVTIAFCSLPSSKGEDVREMMAIKNRYGKANSKISFTMTEKGLKFLDPNVSDEDEDEEVNEIIEIPYNTLPTIEQFNSLIDEIVELKNEDGSVTKVKREELWQQLIELHKDYTLSNANENEMIEALEWCGFKWSKQKI